MNSTEPVESNFKLHVSFAEADIEFVDNVLAALGQLNRFDLSVTPGGEEDAQNWVREAGSLIEAADAIVYVLSPASVALPTIAYEAERASALSKRMMPIICQPLRKAVLPAALSGLRPLRMETQQLLNSNLQALLRLLAKDAAWTRQHTQLYLQARAWQDSGHDSAYLLSGAETVAAKAWTFEREAGAPKPTDLHMEFIEASEAAPMGLQNGARRTRLPITPQRARRKPKPETPAVVVEAEMPEPASVTEDVQIAPIEVAAVPESTSTEADPATASDDMMDGSDSHDLHPQKDVPEPEVENADPVETAEPADPPAKKAAPQAVKKTARKKSKLWKLRRKPKARAAKPEVPSEAAENVAQPETPCPTDPVINDSTDAQAQKSADVPIEKPVEKVALPEKKAAKASSKPRKPRRKPKMPAKPIAVDLNALAYVPSSLKISRTQAERPCPPLGKAASSPADLASGQASSANPEAAKPGSKESTSGDEASGVKSAKDVSEVMNPSAQTASKANASPLIGASKPKKTRRSHPVIIAQDELDGLLSQLMADADNDR